MKETYCIRKCCGSGSGIRFLFDPWIRDPGLLKSQKPFLGVKILKFFDANQGWKKVSGIRDGKKSDPG
jgi:hypothetical protein